ncbi:MAG: RidA family protein [Bacillota bacterium]
MKVEERIKELGINLPHGAKPVAAYVPVVQTGNLLFVSGQDCRVDGKLIFEGKVGKDITLEQGKLCARQCIINALAALKDYLGDLDRIKRIVKILGFVNSAEGFVSQPYVINGGSELLIEIFGENGNHARSAIACNELPFNTPVEIEMIVEIGE